MKKAFTHEYFIIRRKQHNLGSPDTCSVLNDFLLPSCSSHLSLTTLSVSQTLQRGRPGAAVSPQPRGRTGAQDPKPRGGGSQERASTCLWPFVSSEEKASSSREGLSIVCREKKKRHFCNRSDSAGNQVVLSGRLGPGLAGSAGPDRAPLAGCPWVMLVGRCWGSPALGPKLGGTSPTGGGDLLCQRVPKATAPSPHTPAPRASSSRVAGSLSTLSRQDPIRRTRQEDGSLRWSS